MVEITVAEFVNLCTENRMLHVTLYSNHTGENVWSGSGALIPDKYASKIVGSFDCPCDTDSITVNIDYYKKHGTQYRVFYNIFLFK